MANESPLKKKRWHQRIAGWGGVGEPILYSRAITTRGQPWKSHIPNSNRHNINTIYLYNVIYRNNIIHLFCAALLVQVLILFRVSFSAIDFHITSTGQQRSTSITRLFCPDILKLIPNDCGGKGSTHIRLRRRRVRTRFSRRKHLAPALLLWHTHCSLQSVW